MVGGIPAVLSFVSILTNNLLVYCHVRSTIQRGRRRATPEVRMSQRQDATRQQQPDPQVARVRAVATQAFWYVCCYLITYLPSITLRIMEGQSFDAEDEDRLFPLLVIQSITFPCQGFLNLFVYVRPSYLRIRKDFPDASMVWAFRRAMYGDRIQPRTPRPRRQPSDRPSTQFGASQFSQRARRRMSASRNTTASSGRENSQRSTGGDAISQISSGIGGLPEPQQQRRSSFDSFYGDESKREMESTEERDEDLSERLLHLEDSESDNDDTTLGKGDHVEKGTAMGDRRVPTRDSYVDELPGSTTAESDHTTDKAEAELERPDRTNPSSEEAKSGHLQEGAAMRGDVSEENSGFFT